MDSVQMPKSPFRLRPHTLRGHGHSLRATQFLRPLAGDRVVFPSFGRSLVPRPRSGRFRIRILAQTSSSID